MIQKKVRSDGKGATVIMCNPCGDLLWEGQTYYSNNGTLYCQDCKDKSGIVTDNIVRPVIEEELRIDNMLGYNPYCDARGT